MEWVRATIDGHEHRIAKPVADELQIADGSVHDDARLLDRVIDLNWQYIRARQERIDAAVRAMKALEGKP